MSIHGKCPSHERHSYYNLLTHWVYTIGHREQQPRKIKPTSPKLRTNELVTTKWYSFIYYHKTHLYNSSTRHVPYTHAQEFPTDVNGRTQVCTGRQNHCLAFHMCNDIKEILSDKNPEKARTKQIKPQRWLTKDSWYSFVMTYRTDPSPIPEWNLTTQQKTLVLVCLIGSGM